MGRKAETQNGWLLGRLLPDVVEAARAIMALRSGGLWVEEKPDGSPVTEADRQAETILVGALDRVAPGIPVLAEEGIASGGRPVPGHEFFLVDPLDGTRGFVAGRDDFTINIGLVRHGRPVFGLVFAPARGELFATDCENRAIEARIDLRQGAPSLDDLDGHPIRARLPSPDGLSALVSRMEVGAAYVTRLQELGITTKFALSSAIKFCLLARGDADIYPRFGPTCEWDTAAGEAILVAAGGRVTDFAGGALDYGRADRGFLNPSFIARGGGAA